MADTVNMVRAHRAAWGWPRVEAFVLPGLGDLVEEPGSDPWVVDRVVAGVVHLVAVRDGATVAELRLSATCDGLVFETIDGASDGWRAVPAPGDCAHCLRPRTVWLLGRGS